MAKYDAEQLKAMAANHQAMADGSYPIGDAEDLMNAMHAVGRADHDAIRAHIIKRAKALGKSSSIPDNWNPDGSLKGGGRSVTAPTPYMRSFVLEDISVKPGDGRTVDAYAAVFNTPAQVRDEDGSYEEVIDPTAFNRTLDHRRSARGGAAFPVLFNHGRTLFGTPSERYSVPIGVSEEVRVDGSGLFTRSRFHKTQAADEVLEAIKDGSITGYSFRGNFLRSNPSVPRGGFRAGPRGELKTVHRTELTLDEYGPGTFPVYQGAEIVSVRAEQAAVLINALSYDERQRLVELFRSGTPTDSPDEGTPSDEGPAAEDPPQGHSIRSLRDERDLQRARFLLHQRELQAQRARDLINKGAVNG